MVMKDMRGLFIGLSVACSTAFPYNAQAEVLALSDITDTGECTYFQTHISIPTGWVYDKDAMLKPCNDKANFSVEQGHTFKNSPTIFYSTAVANKDNKSIKDFITKSHNTWKEKDANIQITQLPDVKSLDGKTTFTVYQFESRKLENQPYVIVATTTDTDIDKSEYFVNIVLSATDESAVKKAKEPFNSILHQYEKVIKIPESPLKKAHEEEGNIRPDLDALYP